MEKYIEFIGRNVPSSKNNRILTGKRVIKNKLCQEYTKWAEPIFQENFKEWRKQFEKSQYPLNVEFYFYRDSKRHFDYCNILQIIADLMQDYQYIADDDADHFNPIFTGYEVVKKDKAGFKMRIKIK